MIPSFSLFFRISFRISAEVIFAITSPLLSALIEIYLDIIAFKYLNHNYSTLFLEDESRRIGKILIPEIWYQKMKLSKIIIVDIPIEERIYNIKKEYVNKPLNNGISRLRLNTLFQSSLLNIRKRLGIKNYDEISKIIQNALNEKSIFSHEDWIKKLLTNYYDPMYNYQLSSKTDLCIFKSNKSETIKFMKGLVN